jgi:glycosyltransferase involved in cell wall biosynthesis
MKREKDKLNVVFLGRFNSGEMLSGPEKAAKRIFNEHSKNNKTTFIQYFFDGDKYSLSKKMFGIEEEKFNNRTVSTAGIFKVYTLLRRIKPDIIHIITFERFALTALIYRFFNKVSILYNEHGVIAYENSKLKQLSFWHKLKDKFCEKRLLDKSDKVIYFSERTLNICEEYFDINESRCAILANGIDDIFFNSNTPKNFDRTKAVFIYHNELYKSGLEFLKSCISKLTHKLDLYIISNTDLDIDKVNYVKPMPANELAEFYKDKHIFLALNQYDTFSISTAEAMASGLVPIVTQETGISRYVENEFNGYVIPYGSTDALNGAINDYLGLDVDAKNKLSGNAVSIYNSLDWQSIYETYYNIYLEMLK